MDTQSTGTLLVFVDFTDASLNAVTTAVAVSKRLRVTLHLLYVMPAPSTPSTSDTEPSFGELTNALAGEKMATIQQLATTISQEHIISCTANHRTGAVYQEVVAESLAIRATLVVMGIHVGSDVQAFRTSNEAYQVIAQTTCPVLAVPDTQTWTTFDHILFPVRPIPDALDKYDFARQIIQPTRTTVTVLALSAPNEIISQDQLQEDLAELARRLTQDGISSQTIFCTTDSMAAAVLTKATELTADLVIVTALLTTSSDTFFIGSFTQQLLHTTQLPILAIRPEAAVNPNAARISWHDKQTDS